MHDTSAIGILDPHARKQRKMVGVISLLVEYASYGISDETTIDIDWTTTKCSLGPHQCNSKYSLANFTLKLTFLCHGYPFMWERLRHRRSTFHLCPWTLFLCARDILPLFGVLLYPPDNSCPDTYIYYVSFSMTKS